ncbi:MAG: hypothetical protein JWM86_1400, partial [Thermoleophilia bacterium]|nr:hypothetical protein [Thermoleophilia bacterium]
DIGVAQEANLPTSTLVASVKTSGTMSGTTSATRVVADNN